MTLILAIDEWYSDPNNSTALKDASTTKPERPQHRAAHAGPRRLLEVQRHRVQQLDLVSPLSRAKRS